MALDKQKLANETGAVNFSNDIIGSIISEVTQTVIGKNMPSITAEASSDIASQIAGAARAQLAPVIKREMDAVIVDTEANSDAWINSLPAIWRPIMMLGIFFVLVNNFILAPYLSTIFRMSFTIPLPAEFWQLTYIVVPLFIGARTYEKVRHRDE